MPKLYTIYLIFCFLFVLSGCATKKLLKHASELELSGRFRQAAELYFQAALARPGKPELIAGLQRSGFMYAEDMQQGIIRSYNQGEYQKVVYDFMELESFARKVKNAGVDLQIDPGVRTLYRNAQDQFLEEKYDQGLRLLSEQRFNEARNIFTEIHRLNPDYKDTRANLNIATNEPLYQSGNQHFNQRNYMAAWRDWDKVVKQDPNYKDTRQRMLQALNERYKEGTLFLMDEDFNNAALALGDVFKVNPSYMDVARLFMEARNEPLYRQALASLEANRCRSAFFTFSSILNDTGGSYRDSHILRSRALECATFPIAVQTGPMPGHPSDGAEFENILIQSILNREDPFIKIHTLPSLNPRWGRTLTGASATLSREQLRELYDRHGIKAVLIINYLQYNRIEGRPESTERNGFTRQSFTTEEGQLTYRDNLVKYTEVKTSNNVSLSVGFQLIATQNGQILLTNRFNHAEESNIHYALFDGEIRNLYPASYVNSNWVIDERNYSSLQRLLVSEKQIVPTQKLKELVFGKITDRLSDAIVRYNPER